MKVVHSFVSFLVFSLAIVLALAVNNLEKRESQASRNLKGDKGEKGDKSLTGFYRGIDFQDGSLQGLSILCTKTGKKETCDFRLSDSSFNTCGTVNGLALALGVTDISKFNFDLYCAVTDGANIDTTGPPTATLVGDLLELDGGILVRKATLTTYYKTS